MQHHHRWSAALLLLGALGISACARSEAFDSEAATDEGPSRLEHVKGSDVPRVVLTAQAAGRLGIRTAARHRRPGRAGRSPTRPCSTTPRGTPSRTRAHRALTYVRTPDRRRPHQRPGRAAQGGAARRHRGRHGRRRGAARHRVRRRGVRGAPGATVRWIVGSSLKFRYLVVAAAAALVFFGGRELRHENVDVFPEFAPTRVEIQTACLGLSAAEVEELVTVPLEDALNGVPGVDVIRSESVPQLSNITLLFKRGTDFLKARQLVQEHLQTVAPTLPTWAAPPFLMQPVSSTSRIMKIGLSSKSIVLMDLSMTAYWKIRARILRVPGVANVAIWGERLKQVQVNVDPSRLRTERVVARRPDGDRRRNALDAGLLQFSEGHVVGTGGFVETPSQRITARTGLPIVHPSDLAQVPIARRGGRALRLGDVARVAYGPQPLIGDAVVNDGPGLLLVVEKLQGANTLAVTRGRRRRARRPPSRPARGRARRDDLPSGELHRARDPQPQARAAAGLRARRARADRLPVRVEGGVHQPRRDPALARRGRGGADAAGRVDEHDGPRRPGGGGRGGRRRRHHRHGEHRPAHPDEAGCRQHRVADLDHPARLAGGAQRDPLRDAHQRGGRAARRLRRQPDRRVLPAAGAVLRARGARLDGDRAHGDARAEPRPALPRIAQAP